MSIHNSVRQMLESHLTNTTEETPPACLLDKVPAKPRAILDREKAIEIFKLKKTCEIGRGKLSSVAVAREYGVGEKTVRDIWRGRTWRQETCHLDPSRPLHAAGPPGRPLGRKDTAPRKRPASTKRRDNSGESSPTGVHDEHESDPFHEDWPNWAGADRAPEVEADAIPDVRVRELARRQPCLVQSGQVAPVSGGECLAADQRPQSKGQTAGHTENFAQEKLSTDSIGELFSHPWPSLSGCPQAALVSQRAPCPSPWDAALYAQAASPAAQWTHGDIAGTRGRRGARGEQGDSQADPPARAWPFHWQPPPPPPPPQQQQPETESFGCSRPPVTHCWPAPSPGQHGPGPGTRAAFAGGTADPSPWGVDPWTGAAAAPGRPRRERSMHDWGRDSDGPARPMDAGGVWPRQREQGPGRQ